MNRVPNEPKEWMFDPEDAPRYDSTGMQNGVRYDMSLIFEEPVYRSLDAQAFDGVRQIVLSSNCGVQDITDVRKDDAETIEVVYREGDTDYNHGDLFAGRIQTALHQYLPGWWRAQQKRDKRFWNNKHPARIVVRCVEGYTFKYDHETDANFKAILHGLPDGIPSSADVWGDLDRFDWKGGQRYADLFVYESDAGTQHVVPRRDLIHQGGSGTRGFYDLSVTESVSCPCGYTIPPETVVDPGKFTHYAEYVKEFVDAEDGQRRVGGDIPPDYVLDNICGSCWRTISDEGSRYPNVSVDDVMQASTNGGEG